VFIGGHYFFCALTRMKLVTGHIGWIEIVCGPMFSGKSAAPPRRRPLPEHACIA
jgi:hypothetical protein